MHLFSFRKHFCDLSCFFFGMVRREWEERPRGRYMVCKSTELCCSQKINSCCKFRLFQVKFQPLKILDGSRNRCPCKLHLLMQFLTSIFIYSSPSNTYIIQYSSWKHAHIKSALYVLCYTTSPSCCSLHVLPCASAMFCTLLCYAMFNSVV